MDSRVLVAHRVLSVHFLLQALMVPLVLLALPVPWALREQITRALAPQDPTGLMEFPAKMGPLVAKALPDFPDPSDRVLAPVVLMVLLVTLGARTLPLVQQVPLERLVRLAHLHTPLVRLVLLVLRDLPARHPRNLAPPALPALTGSLEHPASMVLQAPLEIRVRLPPKF